MERPPLGAAFLCRLSMSIVSGLTYERAMWLSGRNPLAKRPTMCVSNPHPRELPKTQTTSVKMGEFRVFCSRWSAFWALSPSGRPLDGGNCIIRVTTRRQSAPHAAKPPLAIGLEGAGGSGGPEGLAAVPVGGGGAWSRQISHIISDGHFLRQSKNIAIPTR